jgi:uncharacterized membrane protein
LAIVLRCVRILAAAAAFAMLAVLPSIALNVARFGDLTLTRFRGPTYLFWLALAVFVLAREHPVSAARKFADRARDLLSHPRFYSVMAGLALVLYLVAALTQYLSFRSFAHDLSIFDESLFNTWEGNFLYSSILGRNFFSEHFAPILLVLLPIYAVSVTPIALVIVHAFVLWAGVPALKHLLRSTELPEGIQNLVCLGYLCHPIAVHTLNYVFHVEVFLPILVFCAWASLRRDRLAFFWISLVLLLCVKEDVGLYVAGLGLYLVIGRRRSVLGWLVFATGVLWTWMAVGLAIPAFGGSTDNYAFVSRWGRWGASLPAVLWGWISHPIEFASAIFSVRALKYLACLAFLPLVGRWTWLLIAAPWVINATSSLEIQARLGLYYGIPFLAFALIAVTEAIETSAGSRPRFARWAPAVAAAAVVLNVAYFTFPEIPRSRRQVVEAIRSLPEGEKVAAMPCLYPVLERTAEKTLIWPRKNHDATYEVLRTSVTTWPFTAREVEKRIERRLASGRWKRRFELDGFVILERRLSETK